MVHLYRYILHKRDHRVNIKNGNGNDPFPDGEFGARGGGRGVGKASRKRGRDRKAKKTKNR